MAIRLRGGYETLDPRLDRIPQFDERSRQFSIRAVLTPEQQRKPRSYTWRLETHLNQLREGACVGFSWAHELAARPAIRPVSYELARSIYKQAQFIDEWPGEEYEGTSVLAGAKVVKLQGHIAEYRWAFGIDDLIAAVGYKGPAVLGIPWYEGMLDPDERGFIRPTGRVAGGHAILTNQVQVREEFFFLPNSWGEWGIPQRPGDVRSGARVSFSDLDRLLHEWGEACIPVLRLRP